MLIIYDFDGTLTPNSMPQYPILQSFGYTDSVLNPIVKSKIDSGISFYEAYYICYENVLKENNIPMNRNNVCYKAQDTQFNKGVLDYFKTYQNSKTGIKHYVVTSGLKYFIEETPISKYVDGIYGVTYNEKDGLFQDIDVLLTDVKKVDVIKELQQKNNNTNDIVYFGDGMTDKLAFKYVHSIGGKTVFISSNNNSKLNYEKLNNTGIITKCFNSDFGQNSEIRNYIESLNK